MKQRNRFVWLGYWVVWGLLSILAALTVWQAHITTIYLATLLVNNPALRPSGWNSGTIVGVSKLSVLGWGSLWLIGIYYIEYQLRESAQERRLLKHSIEYTLILFAGLALVYALTFL